MDPLALIKGFTLDNEFNRDDILLVNVTNTSGVGEYGNVGAISQKYPYFNILKDRVRSHKGNWATPESRGDLGSVRIFTPPHTHTGPTIASLLCHYGEFQPNIQECVRNNHPDPEHQKNILKDGDENRLMNFYLSLEQLQTMFLDRGSLYSPFEATRTIVFPFLAGCVNIKFWLSEYLPQIVNFSREVYRYCRVRTVIVMSKYLHFLMKENPEMDDVCRFSRSLGRLKIFDSFNSYETAHLWMSDTEEVKTLERENVLRKLKAIKAKVKCGQESNDEDDEPRLTIDCPPKRLRTETSV